ncbi:Serine/arginine repetitive matrix protein 2 isoform 2 [Quillaja saponaria]|uniref:Serine/arginine repetitive matrix protein 2 isoform 2 n=1 Tax=Quillaja saponaria TaxID=32244 RepID=A0AAD7LD50_QUISA|nr:Serine/arginine repetitive matrix protein 2 isoform 2 [Quillaja saponaria]
MATPSKFDLSSSSPDRPLYTGQRGSHIATSLDRCGSFRESMENPSLPNMSRGSSTQTQGDVMIFFQCLRFDPKLVAAEHKCNRQVDFKRHVNVALGISSDDSPSNSSKGKLLSSPSPDEIKSAKAGLRESSVKARERVKIFSEALSVFNKIFPTIPSKKRSRSEGFANDRSGVMLSERSVLGPSIGKVGVQSHGVSGNFELEQQKSEERTKNVVPNKRTRTSLMDGRVDMRSNPLVRQSGNVDRDKEILRLANNGSVQGEDRTLPIGADGWEKSKMKKKRSGIKPDGSPSTALSKLVDGYRESKQGMTQRLVTDARSKLNHDSHSFRQGVANGAIGVGKSDAIPQQTGLGMRSSAPRTDQDNNPLVSDRRDRPVNSDKERGNHRAINKATVRDELNSASPTSITKMNTSVRAPRTGSGVAPKMSPVVHRASASNDWEMSHCTNKPPAGVGANNRKRMASARSSSPPVAHWAGQRAQKISRTARRTNLVPIVSSTDDIPALDTGSDVAGSDIGLGFARRFPGSSPQQVRLKGDPLSSATLSESEESGVVADKPKDKGRKPDEVDQKAGQSILKASTVVLHSRKNKLVSGEEHGDGVRRQGRSGRGFTSTRSLMPLTVEKLGNVGTAKQLRSARLGFDKSESKAGRPPTRKLSDRKAYTRQKHTAINTDFLGSFGSDDGHEDLLAAADAVIMSAHSFSSPFWRQMEPFFGLISDVDISYLKQQGNLECTASTPTPEPFSVDGCESIVNGFGLIGFEREMGPAAERIVQLLPEKSVPATGEHNVIPLCQKLIAALITEEDCVCGSEDFKSDAYESDFELDGELQSNLNYESVATFQFSRHSTYNGYRISGKAEHDDTESDIEWSSNFAHSLNGLLSDKSLPTLDCSEFQYDSMDINEKLLLEIQSIGIFPEPVPDMAQIEDEGISEDIVRLEGNYHGQISKKKSLLDRLLKSAFPTKELQEKQFEQRALDKLIGMAYEKYMACWGQSTSGGKSSSKMAKQAALVFLKRALERCHQFEDSGKSCFDEPLFKDMLCSRSSHHSSWQLDTGMEGESLKAYASIHPLETRISASMALQQSPSPFSQNMDNHDLNSSDVLMQVHPSSEQTCVKEDTWSNRVKKRELLLDDVGGMIVNPSVPSGIGGAPLLSSAKGRRSERDRDGKGHGRELLSRNGTTKVGRPALSSDKGERKSKAKPKQRTTQLSVSVNGLLGKNSEQAKPASPSVAKSNEMSTNSNAKEKDEIGLDGLDDHESIDLSNLQLPGMDVLGGQGQDLGSWLNIEDDGLQDHDFMGLEIPMDDLSDLNMMV